MGHVAFFFLRQMIQWCFVSSCIPSTRREVSMVKWHPSLVLMLHWLSGCLRACWGVGACARVCLACWVLGWLYGWGV